MEQYQIPQFIEVESKIIGPMTLKQFGYVVTPFVLGFILSAFLEIFLVVIIILPLVILGLALAFLKIRSIPFPKYLMNVVSFSFKNKVYIFKKGKETFQVVNLQKLEAIEKILKNEKMTNNKSKLEKLAGLIQAK